MKKTQVVATHPNMFELTPQRPALLDGTSTFQLLLWQGCVRAGNRVKVHVEASPAGRGGEQVSDVTKFSFHQYDTPYVNMKKYTRYHTACIYSYFFSRAL